MEEMSLESVNKQLERLYNEREFVLNRIENILTLVLPKGTNTDSIRVDGGERVDKLLKYIESKDELILDEKIRYLDNKINDLESWRDKELQRLNKYDDLVKLVVYFKEEMFIKDKRSGKLRHLTWDEIAHNCYCSEKTARNKYNIAIQSRKAEIRGNIQEKEKSR